MYCMCMLGGGLLIEVQHFSWRDQESGGQGRTVYRAERRGVGGQMLPNKRGFIGSWEQWRNRSLSPDTAIVKLWHSLLDTAPRLPAVNQKDIIQPMRQMEKIPLQDTHSQIAISTVCQRDKHHSWNHLERLLFLPPLSGCLWRFFGEHWFIIISCKFEAGNTVETSERLVNQEPGWSWHTHYYSKRTTEDEEL